MRKTQKLAKLLAKKGIDLEDFIDIIAKSIVKFGSDKTNYANIVNCQYKAEIWVGNTESFKIMDNYYFNYFNFFELRKILKLYFYCYRLWNVEISAENSPVDGPYLLVKYWQRLIAYNV